jgi:RNA polymerase sigma-70 factor (ECF subfamily)
LLSLDSALASIPEKYRIAVTLHYLEGFSVEEIASILRIGVSAVKMRLSRGREALKDKLEKEENNV